MSRYNIFCHLCVVLTGLVMVACSSTPPPATTGGGSTYGKGGTYKVGNPYKIAGRWYHPKEDQYYNKVGIASWYGPQFHGKTTANGERFNMNELTAAHTTLPMPTYVKVTNLENNRYLILRVNDRGPFVGDRIIDVSRRSAQLLGFERQGTARVRVEVVTPVKPGDTPVQEASVAPASSTFTVEPTPDMPAAPPPQVDQAVLAPLAAEPVPAPAPGQKVFVQAGAFTVYENARRMAETLLSLGAVTLTPVRAAGLDVFRVRIGPLASLQDADTVLGQVVAHGYDEARIVVD